MGLKCIDAIGSHFLVSSHNSSLEAKRGASLRIRATVDPE